MAIQCTNELTNGKPKDFLFTGESKHRYIKDKNHVASPFFDSIIDLYKWMQEQGFETQGSYASRVHLSPAIEFDI